MTKEKQEKLRTVYGFVFALFTLLVGGLMIMQTWRLYRSTPNSPYTAKNISKYFGQIAPCVWLWLIALAGNIGLSVAFPQAEPRPKAYVDLKKSLTRLEKRLPTDEQSLAEIAPLKKQREVDDIGRTVCYVTLICVVLFVSFAILLDIFYLPIIEIEFFAAHNGAVDRLVQASVLTLFGLSMAALSVELMERGRKKTQKAYLEIIKKAKTEGRVQPQVTSKEEVPAKQKPKLLIWWENLYTGEKREKSMLITRIVVASVALILVIVGICNGGMKDVLLKAVNICTQCIGLG